MSKVKNQKSEEIKNDADSELIEEDELYIIYLDQFKGSITLLLQLIEKSKIEIKDVFVSDVTQQFIDIVNSMDIETMDFDKAAEFFRMAAYLLEMKAKSLLPKIEKESNETDLDDPDKFVEFLKKAYVNYYQQEVDKLKELEKHNVHYRAPDETVGDTRTVLKDMNLDGLYKTLMNMFEKVEKKTLDQTPKAIQRDPFTVDEKINYIKYRLSQENRMMFTQLFSEMPSISELITTFQAMLELMKLQYLSATQTETFGDIELNKLDERLYLMNLADEEKSHEE